MTWTKGKPPLIECFPLWKNDSTKNWVVQKFGGTSVGKLAVEIVEDVVRASLRNYRVAIVCSARSTDKKADGTTSRLLEIYAVLEELHSVEDTHSAYHESLDVRYVRLVHLIEQDHINAVYSYIRNQNLQLNLIREIQNECQAILDYRVAAKKWCLEIDFRSKDRIVSFGEKLSCRFVAGMLQDRGIASEYVDLSDSITSKTTCRTSPNLYDEVISTVQTKLSAWKDRVPVITGYFGTIPGGLVDGEVGRGYSDLCAALVAAALNAKELQIWKEIDGIFTADPAIVPTARLLHTITPLEAAELTFYGSEVIHPFTIEQVTRVTPPINVRIKNVRSPGGHGTMIVSDIKLRVDHSFSPPGLSKSVNQANHKPKRLTAITIKDKICVVNVRSNKLSISHGFFFQVFSILNKRHLSVDLISTSEANVSMAIHSTNIRIENLQKVQKELELYGEVNILHDMAILSLVGAEMKNMVGIAGRMFSALGEGNVNIEMISQGASEINISCVIDEREATRAMNIVHSSLFSFLN
ncbi:aspartate kinase-like protein [Tricladium varicosporioides]|nr:aspartate kinase-like protein [Hymenoscyphus varicosporioides]